MFCPRCGAHHPDDASFCPSCGEYVGVGMAPWQPQRSHLSLTQAFGSAASALFTRRAAAVYPVLLLTWLIVSLIAAAGVALTVLAGFGTLWPRRIIDTRCFVKTDDPSGFQFQRPGESHRYWHLIEGCDATRIDPNWMLIVLVGLLMFAVVVVAGAIALAITYRAAAHVVDSDRPTLPPAGATLRAAGRVIGWAAVLAACGLAAELGFVIVALVLIGVAGPIGVLIVFGLGIYLVVWWVVPLFTRATLAYALMIVDDVPFSKGWAACRVTMGQAWGYVGLTIAAGVIFAIVLQLVGVVGSQGGGLGIVAVLASLVVYLLQYLFDAMFAVVVALGLGDGRARPAA
jgi:zinc ribbon protein